MNFEIYCDESRQDIPKELDKIKGNMLIGGIWINAEKRKELKKQIYELKENYKIGGEIKWNKIGKRTIEFYKKLIDFYFNREDMYFRCIVIDKNKIDYEKYHNKDVELGFYKFYYQLLHHWIYDNNEYKVFLDMKTNSIKGRIKKLGEVLNNAHSLSQITVQALPSNEVIFIQLVDVILGAVSAKFNPEVQINSFKKEIIKYIEEKIGGEIKATDIYENKFNIFVINFHGNSK